MQHRTFPVCGNVAIALLDGRLNQYKPRGTLRISWSKRGTGLTGDPAYVQGVRVETTVGYLMSTLKPNCQVGT